MKIKCIIYSLILTALILSGCKPNEEEIKTRAVSMAQNLELSTVEYTVKKIVKFDDEQKYSVGDRKIYFSTTAYLKAGVKLDTFSGKQIQINDKSIIVTLPHAELLSFNMPAEEITTIFENYGFFRSRFSEKEQNEILKKGEADIMADISTLGILQDAEKSTTDIFKALFSQLGYEQITINFN